MTESTVSVVVVSRGRAAALCRCLSALEQLFYDAFEVVVVADKDGILAVQKMGLSKSLKLHRFDEPNISAARNIGIAQSAGDIVAFIDDDAVPEPTWLGNLVAPFSDGDVATAGGFVRGRNGISFQSKGSWVDNSGRERFAPPGIHNTMPGQAIKTVGTNCAFRRGVLASLGGFDPNFRFYLDETDVNLRFAIHRHKAAVIAEAEVHHGFMASAYRSATRMPTSLYQIGASVAVFARKHAPDRIDAMLERERQHQKRRLIRYMNRGLCEPRDIDRLAKSLENGFVAGHFRETAELPPIPAPKTKFLRFVPRIEYGDPLVLSGRSSTPGLTANASAEAKNGRRVSLFRFSLTALYHRVAFKKGVWIQSGGLFGRSNRSDPLVQFSGRRARLDREIDRVSTVRGLR